MLIDQSEVCGVNKMNLSRVNKVKHVLSVGITAANVAAVFVFGRIQKQYDSWSFRIFSQTPPFCGFCPQRAHITSH